MTGISIETIGADDKATTTRYATYDHVDTGRAIFDTHVANFGKVTLYNHKAGSTVPTKSLSQKIMFRYTMLATATPAKHI